MSMYAKLMVVEAPTCIKYCKKNDYKIIFFTQEQFLIKCPFNPELYFSFKNHRHILEMPQNFSVSARKMVGLFMLCPHVDCKLSCTKCDNT